MGRINKGEMKRKRTGCREEERRMGEENESDRKAPLQWLLANAQ